MKLPGFNLRQFELRGMTYIMGGGITINVDIDTDDEIKNVYFVVYDVVTYRNVVSEPPFEFNIKKRDGVFDVLRGRHKIGVKVDTVDGNTAMDEIDVFFIP